jgi:hypothetical protein
MELLLNDYGLELDTYLGSLYLPWHTIGIVTALVIAYKIYKIKKNNKLAPLLLDENDDWMTA